MNKFYFVKLIMSRAKRVNLFACFFDFTVLAGDNLMERPLVCFMLEAARVTGLFSGLALVLLWCDCR